MEQKELRIRHDSGELTMAKIIADDSGKYWNLITHTKTAGSIYTLTSQRSVEPRVFKTIDAAAKTARDIGFKKVTVEISKKSATDKRTTLTTGVSSLRN